MNVYLMYHDLKKSDELISSDYDVSLRQLSNDIEVAKNSKNENFIFTFDDGKDGCLLAAELLAQHDIYGIFFIITSKIACNGYLDEKQIKEINDMGHDIASHSHTHPAFSRISDEDVRFELERSKDILQNIIDEEITDFCYPGGKRKKYHSIIAKEMGYKKVFNSFEKFPSSTSTEIPRFHVRQSNRGCVARIARREKAYIFTRYLRSCAVEAKDMIKRNN